MLDCLSYRIVAELDEAPPCEGGWRKPNAGSSPADPIGFSTDCVNLFRRKVNRPSREELEKLLEKNGYSQIGRMFNVSDNAIRKWEKFYGMSICAKNLM